jgi:hypothetical protein
VKRCGKRADHNRPPHAFNARSADAGAHPLSLKIDLIVKVNERKSRKESSFANRASRQNRHSFAKVCWRRADKFSRPGEWSAWARNGPMPSHARVKKKQIGTLRI